MRKSTSLCWRTPLNGHVNLPPIIIGTHDYDHLRNAAQIARQQPQHEWPAWTSEFVRRFACMCPLGHVHARVLLAHGNPAAELLRFAEEQSTDLMVLAWRGLLQEPRAAVLREIVAQAHCPLMVVRA